VTETTVGQRLITRAVCPGGAPCEAQSHDEWSLLIHAFVRRRCGQPCEYVVSWPSRNRSGYMRCTRLVCEHHAREFAVRYDIAMPEGSHP
jgi:hypothetical protein